MLNLRRMFWSAFVAMLSLKSAAVGIEPPAPIPMPKFKSASDALESVAVPSTPPVTTIVPPPVLTPPAAGSRPLSVADPVVPPSRPALATPPQAPAADVPVHVLGSNHNLASAVPVGVNAATAKFAGPASLPVTYVVLVPTFAMIPNGHPAAVGTASNVPTPFVAGACVAGHGSPTHAVAYGSATVTGGVTQLEAYVAAPDGSSTGKDLKELKSRLEKLEAELVQLRKEGGETVGITADLMSITDQLALAAIDQKAQLKILNDYVGTPPAGKTLEERLGKIEMDIQKLGQKKKGK